MQASLKVPAVLRGDERDVGYTLIKYKKLKEV